MIGRTISHYRVLESLGAGGMGEVYRAHDEQLRRDVALKVLPARLVADPAARQRLIHEACAAAVLNHPNVCTIHEVGEDAGQMFISMELVEGQPLAKRIPAGGLAAELVLRYGIQIADALEHAHARGVVHRDLKSANIVITPEGRAKVLDFGLAHRATRDEIDEMTRSVAEPSASGSVSGTLHYMPPEVLRGQAADARSDIWSLGVVLYEAATGQHPFSGRTGFEVSEAILRESPAPFRVPPGLRRVIELCLAKEPGERYQRAGEIRAALEIAARESSAIAVGAAFGEPAAAAPARRASWVLGGYLVAAAALLTLVLLYVVAKNFWAEPSTAVTEQPIRALAVLPLRVMGSQAGEEILGEGMADTIITRLGQMDDLAVRPTSAVRKYARPDTDPLAAAREQQVDAVLEGSVQRSGDRWRINLNLRRAKDGITLWSESVDENFSDLFAMQDSVAGRVVSHLRARKGAASSAPSGRRDTSNTAAYESYLKGMQDLDRRGLTRQDRATMDSAIAHFRRAVELDPAYALAYAQLSYAYTWMALFNDPGNRQWVLEAQKAMQKAESLHPGLPQLHLTRYELLWSAFENFQTLAAARELRRAIEKDASVGHEQLSVVYAHMGLEDLALAEVRRGLDIDPTSEINRARYVETFDLCVRPDDAIAASRNFGDSPAISFYLRKSWLWKNDFGRARELNREQLLRDPRDPFALSNQALLAALEGRTAEAERQARSAAEVARESRAFHHVAYNLASIYALQGNAPAAVSWLRKTADAGMPNYTLFLRDPHLDKIRSAPEFVSFMNEMKAAWEASRREFGG